MKNVYRFQQCALTLPSVTRAKLAGMAQYARARGTAAEQHYPQTERGLAELLVKSAEEIGPSSSYGRFLFSVP